MTQQLEPIDEVTVGSFGDLRVPRRIRDGADALDLLDDGVVLDLVGDLDAAPVPTVDLSDLRVAVIGLGYVGFTTALAFMERRARVIGYDRSPTRLGHIAGATTALAEDDRIRLVQSRDRLRLVEHPLAPDSATPTPC